MPAGLKRGIREEPASSVHTGVREDGYSDSQRYKNTGVRDGGVSEYHLIGAVEDKERTSAQREVSCEATGGWLCG